MTDFLDELAYESPFRNYPPLGKFLFCVSLLLASLVSESLAVPLLVFGIGLFLLYISTKFRIPKLLVWAYLNSFVLLFVSVVVVALSTPGNPVASLPFPGLVLTDSGANLAAKLFLRALAGFTILIFFATSTPIPHLAFVFRELGLPKFVSEMTILIYRYSFMILEQLHQMMFAAECRLGFRGFLRSLSTTARISGGLLARSFDFAERAEKSLYSRGFKGDFPTLRTPKKTGLAWYALSVLAFLLLTRIVDKVWIVRLV